MGSRSRLGIGGGGVCAVEDRVQSDQGHAADHYRSFKGCVPTSGIA